MNSDQMEIQFEPNYVVNHLIAGTHALLSLFVLCIFPIIFLPNLGYWFLTIFCISLLSYALFTITHEAMHGSLASKDCLPYTSISHNTLWGRVLGVCYGSPFDFMRTAHLIHHKVSRSSTEQLEIYDVSLNTKERIVFFIQYYFYLFGGLYILEILIVVLWWLPRSAMVRLGDLIFPPQSFNALVLKKIVCSDQKMRAIRIDSIIILVLVITSFTLYGKWWWILATHFLIRALLISFFDYLYHYGSPLNDNLHGYNLRLPHVLSKLMLNFNYHGIHHRYSRLSWQALPKTFTAENHLFDASFFKQAIRQCKGPIPSSQCDTLNMTKHTETHS